MSDTIGSSAGVLLTIGSGQRAKRLRSRRGGYVAVIALVLTACVPPSRPILAPVHRTGDFVGHDTELVRQAPVPGAPTGVTAFVDVSVIPMDSERVLTRRTVLVEGGRIRAIGPIDELPVPAGARRIDGHAKFLIPGLADMHVHLGFIPSPPDSAATEQMIEWELFLFLANGVTTIRNVDYYSAPDSIRSRWYSVVPARYGTIRRMRAQAAAGAILSPRIYTSARWKILGDTQSVEQNLLAYQAAGYDFIKVHGETGPLLDSIAAVAHLLGLPIVGHAPDLKQALAVHQASIEHLDGYPNTLDSADSVALDELARQTQRAGIWNCPTSAIYERADSFPGRRRIVRVLQRAGAGLLLGTDAPHLPPGAGASAELQSFVRAGLTPYQALATATRNPAAFFGALAEAGTISVGKRADLVLLTDNPLVDIRHAADLAGVMIGGRWLSATEIAKRLDQYATSHD